MGINYLQIMVTGAITMFAAALSSYLGVRVALAEIKAEVAAHRDRIEGNESRIERLEGVYFTKAK